MTQPECVGMWGFLFGHRMVPFLNGEGVYCARCGLVATTEPHPLDASEWGDGG